MPRRALPLILPLIASLLLGVAADPASGAVKRLKPLRVDGRTHVFDVSAVRHRKVVSVRLRAGSRRRAISPRTLKRRRLVRLRVPRAWSRRSRVRLDVVYRTARGGKKGKRAAPPPPAEPAPATLGQPSCAGDAVTATTASGVRSAVAAGNNVCVTANVGDLDLSTLPSSSVRYVGTSGAGAIGHILINDSSRITLRARFRSIAISGSNHITIEQSRIGGTSTNRTLDQLIFVPNKSDDLTIRDNDIGWTTADNTGNTGYGIRAYRDHDRLSIERNYIHHIGGDGIQLGLDGEDVVVDRNEIAYVAPPPTSDEHSDDIQITGNGPNTRITNNYLHHNGWLDEDTLWGGSGPYIHAGTYNGSLLFENNLIRDQRNYMQVGSLGTGGCERSNLTFRRNTFANAGTMWAGAADLFWRLCGGTNNVYERNVVNETFWNEYGFAASGTAASANLHGAAYTIDANGDCTAAACNPTGAEPIGYRKPSGVHW